MQNKRYPKIFIRSKNEFAKRISGPGLTKEAALVLINDVVANYASYWRDQPYMSQPKKGKWVRDASYTKLGKLLKLMNERVLKPYDSMLPNFIFGGVTGRDHKAAAKQLLGKRRKRVMLKLDVSRFFEQIHSERVEKFFAIKGECGSDGARLLAGLCCVAIGAKDAPTDIKSLARGFATSSRLAVWCNLDTFIRLERLVQKELKGKDPRIAIYVDDIGITASGATKEEMMQLYHKAKAILELDRNQPLPLNDDKTKIVFHSGDTYDVEGNYKGKWAFEILGQQLNRNTVTLGSRTRWNLADVTHKLKSEKHNRQNLKLRKKSLLRYRDYLQR
jgi:hypothetical protein